MYKIFDARNIRNIGLDENSTIALDHSVETSHSSLSHFFVKVGHHDVGTFEQKTTSNTFAKALSSTGHHDGFVFGTTRSATGSHTTTIIFHFPVVDEIDLSLSHRMSTAKVFGQSSNLHGIFVYIEDDVALSSIIANSHQTNTFDKNHLGQITKFLHKSGNRFLSLSNLVLAFFGIDINVVRFAINNAVGRERTTDFCVSLSTVVERFHQRILAHFQHFQIGAGIRIADTAASLSGQLNSFLTQHHTQSGQNLFRARASVAIFDKERLHFQLSQNGIVLRFDFFDAIGSHKNTVILQPDNRRFFTKSFTMSLDRIFYLFK